MEPIVDLLTWVAWLETVASLAQCGSLSLFPQLPILFLEQLHFPTLKLDVPMIHSGQ